MGNNNVIVAPAIPKPVALGYHPPQEPNFQDNNAINSVDNHNRTINPMDDNNPRLKGGAGFCCGACLGCLAGICCC
ncbi:hypothetical protein COEREDRAFT_83594 [Coemansia reversa NRRL 1564]|uniref:Uncharacterized protein n=1 Tax=Coemansia reversa (strain ATCC 12441 / NRRL 1564) TaxID=763665 RepID=A0A2G5B2Q4_COERN|nr:hypothetical protein COEREDRAFT_83594 [Coemansia reversa NRRL 1564]|eukprot:PIA13303.1 hypothetical protein COEREDRAFT_83594 [Coemansia reversa NRRL 1564]